MANTRLIEEYIRDSGYKLRHVAVMPPAAPCWPMAGGSGRGRR